MHIDIFSLKFGDNADEQILVSQFMENGSLHHRLDDGRVLTFDQRLKILRDVAVGLEYVHHGASPKIIHRDIKSANVLLDKNLLAKLADLGCFKQGHVNTFSIDSSLETANYKGTFGYMDPTCVTNLTVSAKSDVYSFGMLVLELVTGRKAVDVQALLLESSSCKPCSFTIVDPLIQDSCTTADVVATLQLVVSIAYQCVHPEREERPSMIQVVRLLGPAEAFEDAATSVVEPVSPGGIADNDNGVAVCSVPLVDGSVSILTEGR